MIESSLIGHAIQLLEQIDARKQPADKTTLEFFRAKKYLGARDRRYISELSYGILRHKKYIDTLIAEYLLQHSSLAALVRQDNIYLAEIAAYSAAFENDPFGAPHLWKTHYPKVDLEIFAQWIKDNRRLPFLEDGTLSWLSSYYSFPEWLVKEVMSSLGEQTEPLLQSLNTQAKTVLRVNTLKTSREELSARLKDEGVNTIPSLISPAGLIAEKRFNLNAIRSFKDGLFEIQDEGSQLVSIIADPRPGMKIIDGCAGAGGKSLHMAALMRNHGEIISIDTVQSRLSELKIRSTRAGATNIRTFALSRLRHDDLTQSADIVLVDAPCSGTGTIRRNPGLKWGITESAVDQHAERQKELLSFNSRFVKPGGKLLYVTCSLLRRENEDVVTSFLQRENEFFPESANEVFEHGGYSFRAPFVSLMPHAHGTDGFFIAILKRKERPG